MPKRADREYVLAKGEAMNRMAKLMSAVLVAAAAGGVGCTDNQRHPSREPEADRSNQTGGPGPSGGGGPGKLDTPFGATPGGRAGTDRSAPRTGTQR
jgi:hypothetical protein